MQSNIESEHVTFTGFQHNHVSRHGMPLVQSTKVENVSINAGGLQNGDLTSRLGESNTPDSEEILGQNETSKSEDSQVVFSNPRNNLTMGTDFIGRAGNGVNQCIRQHFPTDQVICSILSMDQSWTHITPPRATFQCVASTRKGSALQTPNGNAFRYEDNEMFLSDDFATGPRVNSQQNDGLPSRMGLDSYQDCKQGSCPNGNSKSENSEDVIPSLRTILTMNTADTRHGDKERKRHQCHICKIMFKSKVALGNHIRDHTMKKPHMCLTCGQFFTELNNLKRHQQRHGVKPYKCTTCGKSFSDSRGLRINMSSTLSLPNNPSTVCDKCFSRGTSNNVYKSNETSSPSCPLELKCEDADGMYRHDQQQNKSSAEPLEFNSPEQRSVRCSSCDIGFSSRNGLYRHNKTHHARKMYKFKCCVCDKLFRLKHSLVIHIACHITAPHCSNTYHSTDRYLQLCSLQNKAYIYKCSNCDKRYIIKGVRTHRRPFPTGIRKYIALLGKTGDKIRKRTKKTGDKIRKCTKKACAVTTHNMSSKKSMRSFACETCDKTFTTSSILKRHLRTHTGERPYLCTTCGKTFSQMTNLRVHMVIHSGVKAFKCKFCEKAFARPTGLNTHMFSHSGVKKYSCSVCGRCFSFNQRLVKHMRIHTGEKPYKCKTCGKLFNQCTNLRRHVSIHTGARPHVCKTCGKCFNQASALQSHQMIHSGVKPFVCKTCGKSFYQVCALKSHQLIHLGSKPFLCQTCGESFRLSSSMKAHIRIHTGEKPYQCHLCEKSFCTSSSYYYQIKTHSVNTIF
jgi:KRAB domain-containing zinc finger protein